MKLAASRRKHCKPYARQTLSPRESLQRKMLLLLPEERALVEGRVAMKSLQAWEHITRIREYADSSALRASGGTAPSRSSAPVASVLSVDSYSLHMGYALKVTRG
ncbi:hypothetical protein PF002_g19347 [Phytophthora fragariae]|uniref:Uncharacterized protein n=1 Tax=Phytophthora fragariae TaxID=53985 RepID=A0A6A3XUP2_9STRA|nr:hypothetical protein PF002_g19347 [Phytophthora fragariae]